MRDPTDAEILEVALTLRLQDLRIGDTFHVRKPGRFESGEDEDFDPRARMTFDVLITPEFRMKVLSDPRSKQMQA